MNGKETDRSEKPTIFKPTNEPIPPRKARTRIFRKRDTVKQEKVKKREKEK